MFATVDKDNLVLDLERLEDESIKVSWNVNYDSYDKIILEIEHSNSVYSFCLLYTSPSPRDKRQSRMPSSA